VHNRCSRTSKDDPPCCCSCAPRHSLHFAVPPTQSSLADAPCGHSASPPLPTQVLRPISSRNMFGLNHRLHMLDTAPWHVYRIGGRLLLGFPAPHLCLTTTSRLSNPTLPPLAAVSCHLHSRLYISRRSRRSTGPQRPRTTPPCNESPTTIPVSDCPLVEPYCDQIRLSRNLDLSFQCTLHTPIYPSYALLSFAPPLKRCRTLRGSFWDVKMPIRCTHNAC
jgi:hypothetical protein